MRDNKVQSIMKIAALTSVFFVWGCSDDDDETSGELANFNAFSNTLAPVLDDFNCEACHVTGGIAGDSNFADSDLRAAYDYLIGTPGVINLGNPDSSALGTFVVDNNHNCGNNDCGAIATAFYTQIGTWAGSVNARFSSGVTPLEDFQAYDNFLNGAVAETCGGALCHAVIPPAFVSNDTLDNYNEVIERGFVDLNNPAASPLVTILVDDEHNCFSACEQAGQVMQAAITAWAQDIQ